MALRLSSHLMYGAVRIYVEQVRPFSKPSRAFKQLTNR